MLGVVLYNSGFPTRVLLLYTYLVMFALNLINFEREYAVMGMGLMLIFSAGSIWIWSWPRIILGNQFNLLLVEAWLWGALQFPWVWDYPTKALQMEQVLLALLPISAATVVVWQVVELLSPTFESLYLAQCLVCALCHLCPTNIIAVSPTAKATRWQDVFAFGLTPTIFVFANRDNTATTGGGLYVEQALFLAVLPLYFAFIVGNRTLLVQLGAGVAVMLALLLDPIYLLAGLAVFNSGWNYNSLGHWIASSVAWSYTLTAAFGGGDNHVPFATLTVAYLAGFYAWPQQDKAWWLVLVLCACVVSWQVTMRSWQAVVAVLSLALAGVVRDEQGKIGWAANSLAFVILTERSLVPNQYGLQYFALSTVAVAGLAAAIVLYSTPIPIEHHALGGKFVLVGSFSRFLFPLPWPLVGGGVLGLLMLHWDLYFPLALLVELALCALLPWWYPDAIFPAILCAITVSASVWFQSQQIQHQRGGGMLPKQLRTWEARLLIAMMLCSPLLLCSNDRDEVVLYLGLASLGVLASGLDVFPDWVLLACAMLFGVPANVLVATVTVGMLYAALVATKRKALVAVAALCLLAVSVVAVTPEEADWRSALWLLVVLGAGSYYFYDRTTKLRGLNFDSSNELYCANTFALSYCLVVVLWSCRHFNLAPFALYLTIFPTEIKSRLVLALQVLMLMLSPSNGGSSPFVLLVFLAIAELYFVDPQRMFFASPFLGVLVLLQPQLLLGACTLGLSLGFVWMFETPTQRQVAIQVNQTL
ncbi:hypothetical protein BASA81_011129 [Batrachochytrium salamandrivorans]|nr:hypothetical protein BASA81_011129 [Batrachochytrium salamandrivorans]